MTNEEMKNEHIPLCEVLVKTTYQTQITHPSDIKCENPVGFGCGFIVEYRDRVFFVTADHVVHLDDYDCGERTGTDYVVSIFNNVTPDTNFLATVVTPLGGFHYMESFNFLKPDESLKLIDVSLCIMKQINFQYPFLTDEVHFKGLVVNGGESKLRIPSELFAEPEKDKMYFVYGKIRTEIKGIKLDWKDTLKEELKYIDKSGDYYLLNTPEIIEDYEDWAGLSGSPVLSETGECIGVLCAVTEKSKSIWVMPTNKIKLLMDVAINQEEIDNYKNTAANKV